MQRPLHVAILGLALALMGVLAPTRAGATPAPWLACTGMEPNAVCAYATDRVLAFDPDKGGVLKPAGIIRKESFNLWDSKYNRPFGGVSDPFDSQYNEAGWTAFNEPAGNCLTTSFKPCGASGEMMFKVESRYDWPLNDRIDVVAKRSDFVSDTSTDGEFGLSCVGEGYLVCNSPKVWGPNRGGIIPGPGYITGLTTIETRPLIIRILNMTSQPLDLVGDVGEYNVKRDRGLGLDQATTIPAAENGTTGSAYYHFYRDAERENSVTMTYRFADGATSRSLTNKLLNITITVDKDGSTEQSKCTAPSDGITSIECAAHVLGGADGILEAVIQVGE